MKRVVSSFFLSNHMRFFLLLLLFALVHDGQPTVFFCVVFRRFGQRTLFTRSHA